MRTNIIRDIFIISTFIVFIIISGCNSDDDDDNDDGIPAEYLLVPEEYQSIQAAIDAAVDGNTVLVAEGTYYENINFNGKNITVASYYLLDQELDHIINTVIDGSQPQNSAQASCVLIVSGENEQAMLQGFTLTGGKGTIWTDIHYNSDYREGGGILIELSSPTIKNNLIINNEAVDTTDVVSAGGGGIRIGDGAPLIQNNVIKGNRGRYGAGIVLNFAAATIRNNIVCDNIGGEDYGGSGVWAYETFEGDTSFVEQNTIVNNYSNRRGGGIQVWATSLFVRNNIIWGNQADNGDEQLYINNGSAAVTYCDIQDGWEGEGNISESPLLEQNFILGDDSPCIDSGDPTSANDPEDSEHPGTALYPSKGNLRADMGAYGGAESVLLAID